MHSVSSSPASVSSLALSRVHDEDAEPEAARREAKRAREREWRKRRVAKVHALHTQVAAFERVAIALPLVDATDGVWDEFLDDETRRMRHALQQLAHARQTRRSLLTQNKQLQRLLTEHKLASEAIRGMMSRCEQAETWESKAARWSGLARAYFTPWKTEQCLEELHAAMLEARRFACSEDKETTGLTFMGWQDSRRIDQLDSSFQFSIHKTYRGYDLDYQVTACWRIYTETELYTKLILGGRGQASIDVLQQLTPELLVVMYHEKYDSMDITFHTVVLLATVETPDGVTQFVRSIDTPELVRGINEPGDVWITKSYWLQFDVLDATKPRGATDLCASIRGTMRGHDLSYVNLWLFELLAAVVRCEPFRTGRHTLAF